MWIRSSVLEGSCGRDQVDGVEKINGLEWLCGNDGCGTFLCRVTSRWRCQTEGEKWIISIRMFVMHELCGRNWVD